MSHTEGPWTARLDTDVRGLRGYVIDSEDVNMLAWVPEGLGASDFHATARRIVTACNTHDALVAALRNIVGRDVKAETSGTHAGHLRSACDIARAALASVVAP